MTPTKPERPAGRKNVRPQRRGPRPLSDAASAPLIAIVGRPNVGKSTLFNRLTKSRRALVGNEPGMTRDRIYGSVDWNGKTARLVDTGGVLPSEKDLMPAEIFQQANVAMKEAVAIVMVVDGRTELAAPDKDLAQLLLRSGKPLFLAVNKIDTEKLWGQAENYRQLGIQEMFPVSAEHGRGITELLDAVFAAAIAPDAATREAGTSDQFDQNSEVLANQETSGSESDEIKVAIIGRPNVGKSTLLNALTGTSRAIVSHIAGTTRDAVDECVDRDGQEFRFIDTAGIRHKGKTREMAEKLSVVMARKHLEAADVSLLLIDATAGVTAADATIGGYAHESGRSVVIVVNKWDAVTRTRTDGKSPADRKIFERQLRNELKFLSYAPVLFISAANGQNLGRIFSTVIRVAEQRRKRVGTGEMNRFLEKVDFDRAPVPMSRRMRILYMTQAEVAPPTFVLFTDRDVKLHFSYERFLENQVRRAFGFEGSPIRFKVRARKQKARY